VATTLKVMALSSFTIGSDSGWVVIAGRITGELTTSVEVLLVTEPAELVRVTLYEPASANWTFERVSVAVVLPVRAVVPLYH
jgi:hypothetical protein